MLKKAFRPEKILKFKKNSQVNKMSNIFVYMNDWSVFTGMTRPVNEAPSLYGAFIYEGLLRWWLPLCRASSCLMNVWALFYSADYGRENFRFGSLGQPTNIVFTWLWNIWIVWGISNSAGKNWLGSSFESFAIRRRHSPLLWIWWAAIRPSW